MTLSANYGYYLESPEVGSLLSTIYKKHRNTPLLLNRLAKMEVIRLLSLVCPNTSGTTAPPLLDFINQVNEVIFQRLDIEKNTVPIFLQFQWANKQVWQGTVTVYIH